MSICDKCYSPGRCCKSFVLFGADDKRATLWVDEDYNEQLKERGLPFRFLEVDQVFEAEDAGRQYCSFVATCPLLGPDGRCTDYEARPKLCKIYEPQSSPLCIHFHSDAGDASAEYGIAL